MMKIVEKKSHSSTKLTETKGKVRPAIVHELDHTILRIVQAEGPLTRSRLMALTGIARSTLYDSLMRLSVKGYVVSFSEERKHKGRPKTYFSAV